MKIKYLPGTKYYVHSHNTPSEFIIGLIDGAQLLDNSSFMMAVSFDFIYIESDVHHMIVLKKVHSKFGWSVEPSCIEKVKNQNFKKGLNEEVMRMIVKDFFEFTS